MELAKVGKRERTQKRERRLDFDEVTKSAPQLPLVLSTRRVMALTSARSEGMNGNFCGVTQHEQNDSDPMMRTSAALPNGVWVGHPVQRRDRVHVRKGIEALLLGVTGLLYWRRNWGLEATLEWRDDACVLGSLQKSAAENGASMNDTIVIASSVG